VPMSRANQSRIFQVSQLSALLSVAIDSGLSLVGAIDATFSRANGEVADKFKRLLAALDLGGNLFDELSKLRATSDDPALNELVVKLQVAMQFGSPIAQQLSDLARTLRHQLAQVQLTQATKRENLMLLPLVFLILPVTVLFAVFPALQYLNLGI
jgi:tight adherence protein C